MLHIFVAFSLLSLQILLQYDVLINLNEKIIKDNKSIKFISYSNKIKPEIQKIYKELNVSCQPVAIDSGKVWPKNGVIVPNKTIKISILKPIENGMGEKEFVNLLEKKIYSELDQIS